MGCGAVTRGFAWEFGGRGYTPAIGANVSSFGVSGTGVLPSQPGMAGAEVSEAGRRWAPEAGAGLPGPDRLLLVCEMTRDQHGADVRAVRVFGEPVGMRGHA